MGRNVPGMLLEFGLSLPPLVLAFAFNPQTMSSSRSTSADGEASEGRTDNHDFTGIGDTARASHIVRANPETLTVDILLDATDRMNDGDPIAQSMGVQPEIDTLRSMVEPKVQGPPGVAILAALGATSRAEPAYPSVFVFIWGPRMLPVFLTAVAVEETAHLASLMPYRAEAKLTMQVIDSNNPFYAFETLRQTLSSSLSGRATTGVLGGLTGVF